MKTYVLPFLLAISVGCHGTQGQGMQSMLLVSVHRRTISYVAPEFK